MSHKRHRETPEFGQMVRRMVRAYGRRIAGDSDAAGDIEELRNLAALRAEVDQAIRAAGRQLQASGYSYAELAAALGITRQSAYERFRPPPV